MPKHSKQRIVMAKEPYDRTSADFDQRYNVRESTKLQRKLSNVYDNHNQYSTWTYHHEAKDSLEKNINHLPFDILYTIFALFDIRELCTVVAPVCKLWHTMAHNPTLWRRISLNSNNEISTASAKSLLEKAPLLNEIRIFRRFDLDELLPVMSRWNRQLRVVSLTQCMGKPNSRFVGSKHMNALTKRCGHIRVLELNCVELRSRVFFRDLGTRLPRLRHLTLVSAPWVCGFTLRLITDSCTSLSTLKFYGVGCYPIVSDSCFEDFFRRRGHSLRVLMIDAACMSVEVFREGLRNCPNLKTLRVTHSYLTRDEILKMLPRLDLQIEHPLF